MPTRRTHGTGCTLSAAITALLARGLPLPSAVAGAKRYLAGAIAAADALGVGRATARSTTFTGSGRTSRTSHDPSAPPLAARGRPRRGRHRRRPGCAVRAQERTTWRMITSWPRDLPGPGVNARRLAERITAMSGGRLAVQLYAAGELAPASRCWMV